MERASIWQLRLLDAEGLDSFANDRGLMSFFLGRFIREIWQIGLLNADVVSSPHPLDIEGLTLTALIREEESENYLYADERVLKQSDSSWGGALEKIQPIPSEVKLFFHPFRYYVLYHIDRLLQINISPIQMLGAVERYGEMLEVEIQRFQQLTADPEFRESVCTWNRHAALVIATEPCFFERLFGVIKYSPLIGLESQRQQIQNHWIDVAQCYRTIGLDQITKLHQGFCIAAESLDPNKNVHTMLRLTPGESRLTSIKGYLGGAMCLLTMAEMLRRAAEEVFHTKLAEEDEQGFGLTPRGVKDDLYGAERLLDADRAAKNQYIRMFGLDYGLRLRWYVEGDTEFHAIESILGNYNAVGLVNLRGQVAAKAGRGVAFRDSLRNDLRAHIFSFVSLDGDRSDNLGAVRKAAKDDDMCGMFFVSVPDFEFANFTLMELEEILWSVATEMGVDADSRSLLHQSIVSTKSSGEMFAAIRAALPELYQFGKGEEWGKRLMSFAWERPEIQDERTREIKTRPIVDAINYAIHSVQADYHLSRTKLRVDPATGKPIERSE